MAVAGSTIPNYGTYGWQQLEAEKAYQQALTSIQGRRRSTLSGYGYASDFDESGNPTNVRIDPYSQTGQVQGMLRGDTQQADAAEEEAASRGLGSSGLGQQGVKAAELQHGEHAARLGSSLMGNLSDLTQERTQAEQAHSDSLWQIQRQAAEDALQAQDFTTAPPGTGQDEVNDNELYDQPNDTRPTSTAGLTAAQKARIAQLMKAYKKRPAARRPMPKPKPKKKRRR